MNLSLREKQIVSLGTLVTSAFLIYAVIFSPLLHEVQTLRLQIQRDQALLGWMKQADTQMALLEKSGRQSGGKTSASLLGAVQNAVNESAFATQVLQLQQADEHSIALRLQQVGFDELTKWLINLNQTNQLIITQMVITPGNTPGVVDTNLKLQA